MPPSVWPIYGSGCKKESPPPTEPNETAKSSQVEDVKAEDVKEEDAKAKEFLSDAEAVAVKFENTTTSKLDFSNPDNRKPSFVYRMERANKEDIKKAELTVGDQPFNILLGERPEREFYLYDMQRKTGPYWWGSWSLHSYHKIGGKFYEFMLLENGDKIAGRPYKGEFGIIKVGKGGRELEKVEFRGSVHQAGNVAAPIGIIERRATGAVVECEIPVGDYTAYLMSVTYDNLSIQISNNYHTNAQGKNSMGNTVYGMQVRKDKPYVLDFSNKPMVVFDEPPMSKKSFSRGEEIKFAAVLIDPELDVMIRGLDDTSVQVDREFKDRDGKVVHTSKVNKSLDPKVVITRADGEIVAEGVMPFG